MKLDKLHKLKSIQNTTNLSKIRPLTPIPNPKHKNPSMPYLLLLGTNLIVKSVEIIRGERISRIKHINPHSCTMKANEIIMNLIHSPNTRYFTIEEYRELKREFRL